MHSDSISTIIIFKISSGGMPPDPPRELMLRISLSALRALCGDSSVPPLNHLIISVQIIHYGPQFFLETTQQNL